MFVGRQREGDALRAGLTDAFFGRGRLFLLAGEPGIGKTRLADELASDAATRGARVLWGRCWEGGGAPAYWPWVQIIRQYAHEVGPQALAAQLRAGAADIAPIVPEVGHVLADLPPAPPLDAEQARFRIFDSVTLFLKRAAEAQPLLLLLDDLHAADQPSLLLLQFLARELRRTHLVVIGTYRDLEVRRSPMHADALGALTGDAQRISLGGLSEAEVGTFVAHTFGYTVPAPVVSALHAATDGNPFFVDEVAQVWLAEQRTFQNFRDDPGGLAVPDTVREAIRRRIEPLPAETKRVLTVAALLGREFDLGVLARVAAELTAPLIEHIAEAVAAGAVRQVAGATGRYSFSHALIRETLRLDLPPARRVQLHREIGAVLERLSDGQADANFAELAHHFFQAAPIGMADKALAYAVKAGDRALQQFAYEEATKHYTRALESLKFKEPDNERRCDLLLALADAQRRSLDVPAASDTFLRAAALARSLGNPGRLAAAALGLGRVGESGELDERLIGLLENALASLPPADSAPRALCLGRLAMALYFSPAETRRMELSAEAVAMARRLGDRATLMAALVSRHFAIWGPSSVGERLAVAGEIVRLGEGAGEGEMAMEARLWHIVDLLEAGAIEDADREWERFAPAAADLRLPNYRWHVELVRAMRARLEGRLDEAEQLSLEALALGQQAQVERAAQFFGVQLFYLRRRRPGGSHGGPVVARHRSAGARRSPRLRRVRPLRPSRGGAALALLSLAGGALSRHAGADDWPPR